MAKVPTYDSPQVALSGAIKALWRLGYTAAFVGIYVGTVKHR